jgi:hypothetical protein
VVEVGNPYLGCSYGARCAQACTESASDLSSKIAATLAIFFVRDPIPGSLSALPTRRREGLQPLGPTSAALQHRRDIEITRVDL